jgi:hypothetical protein
MTTFQFKVRWYQRAFHETLVSQKKKRLIEIAHRRWGKDEIVLNGFRELSYKRPGTYWHCFPEYAQARKAIWNGVNSHTGKRRIDEAFPPEIRKRINDNDMFIETIWGSTWQLLGSDRYDATVGSGPVGIAYSEWALCNPAAWAYHKPMIEESNGTAAFITTPRGNNHAKAMFDRAKESDYWFAELSTVADTGALTPEQLAESLAEYQDIYGKDLGQAMFDQEYYCSFTSAIIGAYWGSELAAAEREGRFTAVDIDPDYPVHTAWDLGKAVNNPIWCFQVIGDRPVIVDFYRPESDDLEEWCAWLNKQGYHGTDYVPHDIAQKNWGQKRTRREMLLDCGRKPKQVNFGEKVHTVAEGINAGRQTIKVATFHTGDDERGERVQMGLDGLKNYRREWDDDLQTYRQNPVKDWAEHIGSTWRYLGLSWREEITKKEKPLPKKEPVYVAGPSGVISSNMSVKEQVEAMVRRRARGR